MFRNVGEFYAILKAMSAEDFSFSREEGSPEGRLVSGYKAFLLQCLEFEAPHSALEERFEIMSIFSLFLKAKGEVDNAWHKFFDIEVPSSRRSFVFKKEKAWVFHPLSTHEDLHAAIRLHWFLSHVLAFDAEVSPAGNSFIAVGSGLSGVVRFPVEKAIDLAVDSLSRKRERIKEAILSFSEGRELSHRYFTEVESTTEAAKRLSAHPFQDVKEQSIWRFLGLVCPLSASSDLSAAAGSGGPSVSSGESTVSASSAS